MRFLQFSWLFLLFLLSILYEGNNSSVHGQCMNDQRALLLQLNQSLSFFSRFPSSLTSSKLSSWSSNTDCCSSWNGVICDRAGHVLSLDLSNEFISGGLDNSSSLFNLQYLERLNLAFNLFRSTPIPSGFDQLANLTYLNLSNSGFTGQIPIDISRLTRLVTLDLSTFSPGKTPLMLNDPDLGTLIRNLTELRELWLDGVNISADGSKWCKALSSSLPNLQVLSLSNCYLSGPFDSSLLQLQSLYEIRLDQNNISAEVPELFGDFSNLTSLHLSTCGLYGKFPERILQIQTLRNLYLSNNKRLYGSLPEFPKEGLLETLVLSDTSFSGELPNSIGNLRLLSRLELENCGFNGSIPAAIEKLNQLQYLDLSSNHFTGPIPSIRWSESLIEIDLAHNRLIGPIPSHWINLMKLINLNLKNNSLNGTIPPTLFTLPSLQKLDLSQNQFTGQLGELYNVSSSLLDTLDLSINKLEGPIPTSLFQLTSLIILTLSWNNFNGTISLDMFFQQFRNLSSLDLSGNRLSINASGANSALFPQVGTLKLRSCNLKVFPFFLRNQSKLNHLDLSDNQMRGTIPNWIYRIGNGTLTHLNLSYNFLEDPERPLPDNGFKWLGVLDLRSNMLQGKNSILPPSASFLDYSYNNFTSILPRNPGTGHNFPMLQIVDISSNSFTGTLSNECFSSWKAMMINDEEEQSNHKHMILGFGVDAEESTEEELTEMTGDYDDGEEEDEEGFNGHYCVFCTKLDISRKRAIHNPNCNCHI
ncbi:Leucine-rich repeat [Macleaya cordata]|uniref:Leucine-rich repeat n=1 Tax=Macleaya cordata TaxID=56857 RepID=A0A200PX33_MACCD|nr:Leucine-rich repeat [Macleaya cordata]